ncbi:MAG: hypothetical protein HXX17_02645 [Geobacteraceae bacterium]|nr:hypothetical protein [Geobacteraceae bacterium]
MKTLLLLAVFATFFSARSAIAADGTIDPYSGKPCYKCHRSKTVGENLHGALAGNACAPCHKLSNGSHQQNHSYSEVKVKTSALCYECHADFSKVVSVHGPIAENDCLSCHSPHSSAYKYLLKVSVDDLCFKCHEQSDLTGENATPKTAFRNKTENLHLLHIKKGKVTCLSCHSPHKSSQSHLILDRNTKGKETPEILYRTSGSGGSCTSSCHDRLEYSR